MSSAVLHTDSDAEVDASHPTVAFAPEPTVEPVPSEVRSVADDTPVVHKTASIFASDASCRYPGDEFPLHLSEKERKKPASKYRANPVEFYTKTRRQVITPQVLAEHFRSHGECQHEDWAFWELCSGSLLDPQLSTNNQRPQ